MPEEYIVPGMPWSKCVRQGIAVALNDIREGDEIFLNYELFPQYMMRHVVGVPSCEEQQRNLEEK
jgi:hypothetical protein